MDGSNIEHSDSDSGESWSLVDHISEYGEEAPAFPENTPPNERDKPNTIVDDKDEDTDGISIITDSEPESSLPFEPILTNNIKDTSNLEYVSMNPPKLDNADVHQSMRDDFLGDSNGKHKTYVHRRNKRLSTVLNIIVLGSVITAAGVAIGHMWGAKNDCTVNTTPSVNKILSNLYKLQEENAYLRNKIKELTLANNIQIQQRKSGTEKPKNNNKCRKVFEESLNKIADKPTKCVDNNEIPKIIHIDMAESDHGKEFLHEIDKLKQIYKQNKSWLDDEVVKRLKNEEQSIKKMKNYFINVDTVIKDTKEFKGDNFAKLETISEQSNNNGSIPEPESTVAASIVIENQKSDRKISYADSLKSDLHMTLVYDKHDINVSSENKPRGHKKKIVKDSDTLSGVSEEEFKKDDRYVGPKHKQDRKKHDRQKSHKKQKRKNKYEQWEMKGGYLKDYDDFSITSTQENEYVLRNPVKNIQAKDFERDNYIQQFTEIDVKTSELNDNTVNYKHTKDEREKKHVKGNGKGKDKDNITWFEKRAVFRNEARKKLENELFGETSPNNAGWYFRRMQRREQCRAKGDNSTYKKLLKRNMNFKMKH